MSPKRNLPNCPKIWNLRDLSKTVLPTYSDVVKGYLHERQLIKLTTNKDPSVSKIFEPFVMKIKDLWIKALIPCVSDNRIRRMISNYHSKYRNILKSIKRKKDNVKFKDKRSEFKSHSDKTLLDISSCKCQSFSVCSCTRDRKIPERNKTFLTDQRTSKKMAIGGVNAAVSKKIVIREERKSRFQLFQMKQQKSQDDELLDLKRM